MPRQNTIIIIPVFNEERKIGSVIMGARKALPGARILVVNDGSTDHTGEEARKAGAVVLTHPFNLGYGAALHTGYTYALMSDCDSVVQMDGDGQHDPRSIPALLEPVKRGGTDVSIGSRFLGKRTYPVPPVRRIGMMIFARIAAFLTGQRVTDPTSGFQAMNRRALKLLASPNFPVDYPDADVLVMLHRAGLTFVEVPVTMHPGRKGKSMHAGILGPLYYVFKMFLSLFVTLLRTP